MAVSNQPKAKGDGVLSLADGTTGTAVTLTVPFDNGDFQASGFTQGMRQTAAVESKGAYKGEIRTDRQYIEGSFSCFLTQFTEASGTGTVADFLLQRGAYSGNKSTLGQGAGYVYAVDITITIEGTDYDDAADHTYTLHDCIVTMDHANGDPDQLSFTFVSRGAPTGDLALTEA